MNTSSPISNLTCTPHIYKYSNEYHVRSYLLKFNFFNIFAIKINFNSSGDIAKDCGTAVEDGINKIKSTTTQAVTMVKTLTQTDSLQSVKNPEQETKN